MAVRAIGSADELKELVGEELGVTDWRVIDQAKVDAFADLTGDHQWIHVDTERAAGSQFGGTIAHGFLSLSMCPSFGAEVFRIDFGSARLNYGLNVVRFPSPVPVGSRIRARVAISDVQDAGSGLRSTTKYTIEIEDRDRPACVAEQITYIAS